MMKSKFKVGDRIEFRGQLGVVTASVAETEQIRIKLDSGQGYRCAENELKEAPKDAPAPPHPASF